MVHTTSSPYSSGQCYSSIRQNKHQAGKLSPCFTWEPCQIYLAPSYMLRPDCIAIFTRYSVKIIKKNNVIITGKCKPNGLWFTPLLPPIHQANDVLQ